MSTLCKAAAIAATFLAMGGCSNLTSYPSDTPTAPIDATTNLAMSSMPDVSTTSDKREGGSGSAVLGPTS